MATFITGAGLIGAYTAQRLASRGERVVIYDMMPNPAYVQAIAGTENIEIVRGDIRDLPNLIDKSRGCEYFLHTAGLIGPSVQSQPYTGWEINVTGTLNAAEAARLNGVNRFVFCSTHGALNMAVDQTEPVKEDYPYGPNNLYGASKVAGEQLLLSWDRMFSTDYISLRYPQVYGTGHFLGGSLGGESFDELIRNPWEGKPATVKMFMGGTNEYLYAKDVAQAIDKAFHSPNVKSRVFHIGTGVLNNLQDVLDTVKSHFPNAQFDFVPGVESARGYRTQPYDLTLARTELGYEPEWFLDNGIADYFQELERTVPTLARR